MEQQNSSPANLLRAEEQSQISINHSVSQKHIRQNPPLNILPYGTISRKTLRKKFQFDNIFQQHSVQDKSLSLNIQDEDQNQCQCNFGDIIQSFRKVYKGPLFSQVYLGILLIFLANNILETIQSNNQIEKISKYVDLTLQILFSLAFLAKLIHLDEQNYFWLFFDLCTNFCGYMAFYIENQNVQKYFQAAKTLRLLLIVRQCIYLKVPATNLMSSLSSVGKILFPAAMFIYFYAVIGLYSFRGYQYNKCRDPANKNLASGWTVYDKEVFLCGQKSCPAVNGTQYQCLNPIDYGVEPDNSQVQNIVQGNGLMIYSNIFFSLFSTLKQTFVTGSSRLMILQKQVTNSGYVLLYYLSFIYLLSYIYLNIFYGLMMSNETEDSEQKQNMKKDINFQLKIQRNSMKKESTLNNLKKSYTSKNNQGKLSRLHSLSAQEEDIPKSMKKSSSSMSKSVQPHKNINYSLNNANNDVIQEEKSQFDEVIQFDENILTKSKLSFKKDFINEDSVQENSEEQNQTCIQIQEERLLAYGQIMKKYYIFNHIVVVLCAINICLDFQGQSEGQKFTQDCIDFGFYCLYVMEMLFRIYVHFNYVPNQLFDRASKLDFSLFIFCTAEVIYEACTASTLYDFVRSVDDFSRVARTLKYLRLVLLLSYTPFFNEMRVIFNSTFEAVYSVRYFVVLWLLVLMLFSIMGYHMFVGKTKVDSNGKLDLVNGKPYQVSFEGIYKAVIFTAFVFFNEQWDYFLFQQYTGAGILMVIWQLLTVLIGLQVMSKYFMALLMKQLGEKLDEEQNFDHQNQNIQLIDTTENFSNCQQINTLTQNTQIRPKTTKKKLTIKLIMPNTDAVQPKLKIPRKSRVSISGLNGLLQYRKEDNQKTQILQQKLKRASQIRNLIEGNYFLNNTNKVQPAQKSISEKSCSSKSSSLEIKLSTEKNQVFFENFTQRIIVILRSKFYLYVRISMIICSILLSILMSPQIDPSSSQMRVYCLIWYVTLGFFGLEIFLSIMAFGFFTLHQGYLRKPLNWLYLLIFCVQILNLFPYDENPWVNNLLALRVLRIFIFVELKYYADRDMRLTIVGFWKLFPKIFNLLLMTLIMYGFFAIILVKLYKNDFYYCDSPSNASISNKQDCLSWGGNWIQRKMNVSNFFQSLLYLFLVATTEGWSTQVIEAASLRGSDNEPEYGANFIIQYFFAGFFFFGNMIMLNVFIGLSVYNLKKIKEQVTGLTKLSKDNKMWLSIKNQIYRLQPKMKDAPPDNFLSKLVHTFKKSKSYRVINVILFFLFMINMSLFESNITNEKQQILTTVLQVFVGFFVFQYVISWLALGIRVTRQKKFIFETLGVIYIVVFQIVNCFCQIDARFSRILHGILVGLLAVRYFALLNDIEFIRKMINSLFTIFPQTSNIWLLIFIILITYAVIGVQLFSYLRIGSELNQFDQNYTSIGYAIFTLIKFSILESPIGQIMDASTTLQPNVVCFDIYSYEDFVQYGRMGCGSKLVSYIFFLSFHLIYSLLLMSTLMAVIFDAYSQVRREQQSMVNKFQLQQVLNEWSQYDPEATGYISYRDFWMFTARLVKIYKVNKQQLLSHQTKQSFLKSLEIPIYEDENGVLSFQFHEVVQALTRIVLKQKKGKEQWNTKEADKLFKYKHFQSQSKTMKRSFYDSSHVLTLIILKSGLKKWKRKVTHQEKGATLENLFTFAKKEKEKNDHQKVNRMKQKNNHQNVKQDIQEITLQQKQPQISPNSPQQQQEQNNNVSCSLLLNQGNSNSLENSLLLLSKNNENKQQSNSKNVTVDPNLGKKLNLSGFDSSRSHGKESSTSKITSIQRHNIKSPKKKQFIFSPQIVENPQMQLEAIDVINHEGGNSARINKQTGIQSTQTKKNIENHTNSRVKSREQLEKSISQLRFIEEKQNPSSQSQPSSMEKIQ